jgi:hypothetical protein
LSSRKFSIIRTAQNRDIDFFYKNNKSRFLTYLPNLTEKKILRLYISAKAIILPLLDSGSASGQNVILESVFLKKNIFVTENRISKEFVHYPGVHFLNNIYEVLLKKNIRTTREKYSINFLLKIHSFANFEKNITKIIEENTSK